MNKVSIVIPTYNERENIRTLVPQIIGVLQGAGAQCHVLVVDDNSPDGTGEVVRRLAEKTSSVNLLSRPQKTGLGTAYADGFRWSLTNVDPDLVIQMDADFSHPPEALPLLLAAAAEGYDVVIGSRYVEGGAVKMWAWHRRLISRVANWVSRRLLGLNVTDVTSGFRGLSRTAVERLLTHRLSGAGYVFQVESLYLFSRMGLKTKEIPFVYRARQAGATKLSMMEVLRFLWAIVLLRLKAPKAEP